MRDIGLRGLLLPLIVLALAWGMLFPRPVLAQTTPPTPPAPTPDPLYANVFYGAVNPSFASFKTPVLVFVPGLGGLACDWYSTGSAGNAPCASPANDMYAYAYQWGYRTAFVNPNSDNSPSTSSMQVNGLALSSIIPRVASHYNATKMYFIGHSKGGLDIQQALLDGGVMPFVKGIFTVATPNQGTALATWAFANQSIAQQFGQQFNFNLLTPAVADMEVSNMTAFRNAADPIFSKLLNKPFFYFAGDGYPNSTLTADLGTLLHKLVPGTDQNSQNDGLVTVGEAQLSPEYSNQLGVTGADHFQMNLGDKSFFKIRGRIEALETQTDEFKRLAVNGLARFGGSAHNTWIWSAKWFKGKLYVGTGREELCLSLLASDVRTGTTSYPTAVTGDQCPDQTTLAQSLAAEIWEYTPGTNTWRLAFQSPTNIPVTVNGQAMLTALDVGYRVMDVYTESNGAQVLYVGTVTSGGAFEPSPFQPNGWPAPRILRTTDGQTWTALPQDPGTFLGEIGNYFLNPTTKVRSFRSITQLNGRMFVTAASYEGSGIIISSANPLAGDNSFQQVSPSWQTLPTWDITAFNGFLYATTGLLFQENPSATGYGVYKTAATGTPPYQFLPIVVEGGNQSTPGLLSANGLQLYTFRNELYMGSTEPSELLKIRADDTWDLVVGEPRVTPSGLKAPISGIGAGFGNWMNGHFWRMTSSSGIPDPDQNTSGQTLYLGTWDWGVAIQQYQTLQSLDNFFTHQYGTDVYKSEDGTHWSMVTQAGFGDPNNSGTRTLEATPMGVVLGTARQRFGAEIFVRTSASSNPLAAPRRLRAQSATTAGQTVNLAWDPSPGATKFNVYRAYVNPTTKSAAGLATVAIRAPEGATTTAASTTPNPASFPYPYNLIAQTAGTTYTEPAPSTLPSLYYVRAVDAIGNLSDPSNIVAAPSKAAPVPVLACDITGDGYVDSNDIALITEAIGTPVYGPNDPRDADLDGQISTLDVQMCTANCTQSGCLLQ